VGVNNQIPNRPRVIVDEQIFQVAYVTVRHLDVMTKDSVATAQVAIIPQQRRPTPVDLPRFDASNEQRVRNQGAVATPRDGSSAHQQDTSRFASSMQRSRFSRNVGVCM
jgi:hypothetical protein